MTNIQSQKKIQNIPELRFPEFSGKWEEKKLKDYLHEHKTRNIDNEYTEVFSVAKEKGVINQIEHLGRSYSAESLINYKVIFPDDIVYTKSPTANFPYGIIKQNRTGRSGVVSTLYAVYKPKNKYIGYLIHEYFLSWVHTYNYLVPLVQKGAKNTINIGNSEFLNGSILYLPSIEKEQQKIVSFLQTTDEWTNILRKQKEVLEEYKKGIMQKIFSQEIRFKDNDGKSFPKWEEKKLGEILKERKEYSTKGKGYPHISLTTQGVVPKSERYNRDFLVGDDEVKGYKITRLNDLCYNPANLKFGVISINKLGAGIFSPIYVTFEIIGQNINFVGYYLIRDEFINKARRYEQGTVYERMAVSPADFVKVKVAFPSLPEQQKIADFLTSLDKAIEAKQQQITLAEDWKKGLMQGLFI